MILKIGFWWYFSNQNCKNVDNTETFFSFIPKMSTDKLPKTLFNSFFCKFTFLVTK